MQIAILGKGNMGTPLAALLRTAGHRVDSLGRLDDPLTALSQAQVVLLALRYEQALALVAQPAIRQALSGKTVIDITNPLAEDFMSLTTGHSTSGAEELARLLPASAVVKAFNTIFAAVLEDHATGRPCKLPVFVAGDDGMAVATVTSLVQDMNLRAIAAGALTNARYLEPMTEMMIQLGYGLGHGDRIGFALEAAA
ncbi:NADP oxidoreductase [Pseudooceanicola sp. GBMRC 2024]|uniref:NADP oxidoreductase n=1 Tax=Pseudooceanicola albus TaxID=2692189 RepID=A0A6L7G0Y1_9RHOB|nr:NADP oxidoreductase [Pseudooceanicola albus]MXN17721.1 NADP oxidoreductase [Pseudooceanicola albus]